MERPFSRNSGIILLLLVALAALVLFRIYTAQTAERPRFETYTEKVWQRTYRPQAKRGLILARDGATVLAGNIKRARVIIERHLLRQPERTAQELSPYLGMSAESILAGLTDESKPRSFEIADDIPPEAAEKIDSMNLPGVFIRYYWRRHYPFGDSFAPQTIGYVNQKNGLSVGLENTFQDILEGEDGEVFYERTGSGNPMPGTVLAQTPTVDGESIVTTLDPDIQQIAENVLDETMKSTRASWGLISVMNPQNGEILAVASQPAFDPNDYAENGSRGNEANPLVHYVYEPGSVFKPLISAVALDRGWLSLNEKFNATPTFKVGSYVIHEAEHDHNPAGYGLIPIGNIIVHSSNVGMAQVGLKLGQARLDDIFRTLGLYSPTGVELPAENGGLKPKGYQRDGRENVWPEIAVANAAFGQGIAITPLQLMRAYAAIANGGYLVHPTLVRRKPAGSGAPPTASSSSDSAIPLEDGETIVGSDPALPQMQGDSSEAPRILSETTTRTIRDIMQKVVREGTGKRASIPNFALAGKTGTGQVADAGGYAKSKHNSTFVGMLPGSSPRYLIMSVVANPRGKYYASEVAAPAVAQVAMRVAIAKNLKPERIDEAG